MDMVESFSVGLNLDLGPKSHRTWSLPKNSFAVKPLTISNRAGPAWLIIGGSKGEPRMHASPPVQILSFSCSFWQKNLQNNRLAHPLWELAPSRELPGSSTVNGV